MTSTPAPRRQTSYRRYSTLPAPVHYAPPILNAEQILTIVQFRADTRRCTVCGIYNAYAAGWARMIGGEAAADGELAATQ